MLTRPAREPRDWAEILDRIGESDPSAFLELSRLITTHLQGLRAYDLKDDWDDFIQETVIDVMKADHEGRIRDHLAVPGFVKTIVTRKFFARLKEIGKLPAGVELDDPDSYQELGAANALDDEASVRRTDVRLALDRLTPRQKRLVVALIVEKRTWAEVVKELDAPLGTLRNDYERALERLQKRLGGEKE